MKLLKMYPRIKVLQNVPMIKVVQTADCTQVRTYKDTPNRTLYIRKLGLETVPVYEGAPDVLRPDGLCPADLREAGLAPRVWQQHHDNLSLYLCPTVCTQCPIILAIPTVSNNTVCRQIYQYKQIDRKIYIQIDRQIEKGNQPRLASSLGLEIPKVKGYKL